MTVLQLEFVCMILVPVYIAYCGFFGTNYMNPLLIDENNEDACSAIRISHSGTATRLLYTSKLRELDTFHDSKLHASFNRPTTVAQRDPNAKPG